MARFRLSNSLLLGVISCGLIALLGFTVAQGLNGGKDKTTYNKANELATKLNDYTYSKNEVPNNLEMTGAKHIPGTIVYTKNDNRSYTFCMRYYAEGRASSNPTDPLLYGSDLTFTGEHGSSDYLYISDVHKKGTQCQTIRPSLQNTSPDKNGTSSDTSNSNQSTGPYTACNQSYNYALSYAQFSSTTSKSNSTPATITVNSAPAATYELSPDVKVLNANCEPLNISDLKQGDFITLYFNPYGSPAVMITR